MNTNLLENLKKIKLILTDVDGVLTRGEIFFDALGNELKIWNVKDGLSFSIVKRLDDLEVGWITGRKSKNVEERAKSLDIKYLSQGSLNKIEAYNEIKKNAGLSDDDIMYIGDDLIDISVLKKVGISVCPLDAVIEVKNICDMTADCKGGEGVFRFALKSVLSAQNRWDGIEKIFEI
jgi:3-deoxy-D-manno-octulosonate 8-phosphate phosphatase (KDO 8-P phosphatase)